MLLTMTMTTTVYTLEQLHAVCWPGRTAEESVLNSGFCSLAKFGQLIATNLLHGNTNDEHASV